MSATVLTVIIRDAEPVRNLNEPCTYRSVRIALTSQQREAIRLKHSDEAIAQCFIEDCECAQCRWNER